MQQNYSDIIISVCQLLFVAPLWQHICNVSPVYFVH